jgi:hypothetical protein
MRAEEKEKISGEVGKLLQERIGVDESVIAMLELTDPRRSFAITPLIAKMVEPAFTVCADCTFASVLPGVLDQT